MLDLSSIVQSLVILDTKIIHIEDEYLVKMYNVIYLSIKCANCIVYIPKSKISHL